MFEVSQLHPLMQGMSEGGYYQPSPLRQPERTDQTYARQGFQRYASPELKASGFFGELGTPKEIVSEYSSGGQVPVPGRQVPRDQAFTYPSIYQGITRQRLGEVLNAAQQNRLISPGTEARAFAAAQDRMSQGKSPFWNPQQDYLLQGMR
jgi:hypothetical protein